MMSHYLAVELAAERQGRYHAEARARRQAREARAANPSLATRLARAVRRLVGWPGPRRLRSATSEHALRALRNP
ncbi:MAG: hypothetical protein JWO46_1615 [Nocardioidaceae bacterium]|nr:hypothetical protein [Nocardioidaceae bacterium]